MNRAKAFSSEFAVTFNRRVDFQNLCLSFSIKFCTCVFQWWLISWICLRCTYFILFSEYGFFALFFSSCSICICKRWYSVFITKITLWTLPALKQSKCYWRRRSKKVKLQNFLVLPKSFLLNQVLQTFLIINTSFVVLQIYIYILQISNYEHVVQGFRKLLEDFLKNFSYCPNFLSFSQYSRKPVWHILQ